MADSAPKSVASSSESAVHIVYTERPLENEEPEAYHIRTLASVLGSYKTAASGFSAKLTPQQVEEISRFLMTILPVTGWLAYNCTFACTFGSNLREL
ncbi:subtilisin-like protease SBT3.11 [Prunus yedoensis var. nudiflora]|uniref:Subtilisin-like protease SBT3.11 n=1 Tax=Prunus yedoensis var. nudiflora TaxID=2094558 RepID=A0A314Z9F8_PRUYE|nr:subtilisin-like protease SBT3.11 [Prunus yedoensis var. nudiflora]